MSSQPGKIIYLLIGPKGSGKSFIGTLIEKQFGIKFVRVEDWAKAVKRERAVHDEQYIQEVFEVIEKAVRQAVAEHSKIVFESTGITEYFDRMLDSLKNDLKVVTIGIQTEAALCLERIRTRDQSIHINVSDAEVKKINAQVLAKGIKTDFCIDNDNKSVEQLTGELQSMMQDNYTIRKFTPEDLEAYKAIRLEALQAEHGTFGNGYAMESAFTDEQWMARLTNPVGAIFGLYHGDRLIGITGINVRETDAPGSAYMTHSYIRREYRGKKLSRMLYEIRFAWAREHGIKRLIIGHKKTNLASQGANQHYGFKFTHANPRNWPDGSTEDDMQYELWL